MKSLTQLLDRPIAFHRCLVPIGGATGAIMLSQALYWTNRTKNKDGWFYKTREDWEEETGLSRYEQETARKKLKATGVWEEKLAGTPAQLHYRVNFVQLLQILETDQQAGGDTTSLEGETPPTSGGETNQHIKETETTTETTTPLRSKERSLANKERGGKKEPNHHIDLMGELFTQIYGMKPIDTKWRFEAWNLLAKMKGKFKERGKVATDEKLVELINVYFRWLERQEWQPTRMRSVRENFEVFYAEKVAMTRKGVMKNAN